MEQKRKSIGTKLSSKLDNFFFICTSIVYGFLSINQSIPDWPDFAAVGSSHRTSPSPAFSSCRSRAADSLLAWTRWPDPRTPCRRTCRTPAPAEARKRLRCHRCRIPSQLHRRSPNPPTLRRGWATGPRLFRRTRTQASPEAHHQQANAVADVLTSMKMARTSTLVCDFAESFDDHSHLILICRDRDARFFYHNAVYLRRYFHYRRAVDDDGEKRDGLRSLGWSLWTKWSTWTWGGPRTARMPSSGVRVSPPPSSLRLVARRFRFDRLIMRASGQVPRSSNYFFIYFLSFRFFPFCHMILLKYKQNGLMKRTARVLKRWNL